MPPPLEELLGRLTAKDPSKRPAGAGEVAQALAPYCEEADLPGLAASANLPPATPSRDVETPIITGKATVSAGRSKSRFPLKVIICMTAALLVAVLLWQLVPWSRQPVEIGPSETVSRDSTAVDKVVIWVRRDADDDKIKRWEWVSNAAEEPLSLDPLLPPDAFKIHAEFNRATHWYLVWFDTAGLVEIAAHGQQMETMMDYPREDDRMQQVNPSDPAGLHILALLTSDRPPEEITEELATSLADVGAPPDDLPRLRGAGPQVTIRRPPRSRLH